MKDYIKAEGNGVNYIRIDFEYSKGGYNYFTYREEPRGYYIHVSPVYRSGNMETYTAFSGVKACLFEVTRKSNKSEAEAMKIYEAKRDKYISYIAEKNGLKIEA